MKFLCLGYYNPAKMDARPKSEIDILMRECQPHMDKLYATGKVISDVGLSSETSYIRRQGSEVIVFESPLAKAALRIGSAVIIEAEDMDDAIRIASMHPGNQVPGGEAFDWFTEIRPIHYFKAGS